MPLADVPFDERRGIVPNDKGRIIDPGSGRTLPGLYVSGWIKRGPSGVIGTNKPDSVETVVSMLEDVASGAHAHPAMADPAAAAVLVQARQPHTVTYPDWRRLDALECAAGEACGRPRVKFAAIDEMMAALGLRKVGTQD